MADQRYELSTTDIDAMARLLKANGTRGPFTISCSAESLACFRELAGIESGATWLAVDGEIVNLVDVVK